MKIECIKERLEEALNKANRVAGKNSTLPVLSGLHLSTQKNTLSIKATNLDLAISINIPAKIIEPGDVVVPAQTFSSLISSLSKDKSISLSIKKQTLEVKTPSVKTSIKTLPKDDFPLIPEIEEDGAFLIPVKDFISGLRSVSYAAATGSIRPELSSILITHEKNFLVFVATDSFRLAEKKIKIRNTPNFKQILIPQKNALEIIRIFDKGDEEMAISIEEHQIAIRSQNIYVTSRVVEGIFPDYKQIIPKEITTKVVLLKQDLVNSLKTSLIFSNTANQLTLKGFPKSKIFEIESKNNMVGESLNTLDAALEGKDITININHQYFIDCLQSIGADSVSINFNGQAKPIVLQGVGDSGFLYLMMPMNQ